MILTLVAFAATSAWGQGVGFGYKLRPQFRTQITPLKDGTFQVKPVGGSSAAVTYWCGIGDYAVRTLGVSNSQRIYVSKAYEKGARTVNFSFTPPPGADTKSGYSLTVNRVGENLSAASAQNYCFDNFIDMGF
ncbi:hypothetical protein [Ruegeria arenilitoris]|nr:hypothetical protein [Ruegeria arenilitoris]